MPRRCLLVFAKPPVAGRVKTRLHGSFTPERAAAIHSALLEDLVERVRGGGFQVVVWWAWDDPSGRELVAGLEVGQAVQQGENLGSRMHRAAACAGETFDQVCIVGSDLPLLDADRVAAAFACLDACDVALGPADDGGYYLIAGARLPRALFAGVPWGTSRVLDATLERCRRLRLSTALLDRQRDIDRPDDVAWLEAELAAGRLRSPRVARLFAAPCAEEAGG